MVPQELDQDRQWFPYKLVFVWHPKLASGPHLATSKHAHVNTAVKFFNIYCSMLPGRAGGCDRQHTDDRFRGPAPSQDLPSLQEKRIFINDEDPPPTITSEVALK